MSREHFSDTLTLKIMLAVSTLLRAVDILSRAYVTNS